MATDINTASGSASSDRTRTIRAGLIRRHATEQIFRGLGIAAIAIALGFVAILFIDVFRKGIPAFVQSNLHLSVTFDPAVIDVGPAPARDQFPSQAEFQAAYEIDVWGRLASATEAAAATLRGEQANLDAVALSVAANVATGYLTLRGLDAQL